MRYSTRYGANNIEEMTNKICFRYLFKRSPERPFRSILVETRRVAMEFPDKSAVLSMNCEVWLDPDESHSSPMSISVDRHELIETNRNHISEPEGHGVTPHYRLNKYEFIGPAMLVQWALSSMITDGRVDFHGALDAYVIEYVRVELPPPRLVLLVRDVCHMRCLYEVWRRKAFYVRSSAGWDTLSDSIQRQLRYLAIAYMVGIESKMLSDLGNQVPIVKKRGIQDRLTFWIILMELI
ncbi:hypothetical protein F4778DRAFT_432797 [Xylariomycetidae sp. FL2044]|nr:hypothetical protein F4778DRAFT_432797 [Xylariomycetidae sp. FL2044]